MFCNPLISKDLQILYTEGLKENLGPSAVLSLLDCPQYSPSPQTSLGGLGISGQIILHFVINSLHLQHKDVTKTNEFDEFYYSVGQKVQEKIDYALSLMSQIKVVSTKFVKKL